MSEIERVIEVEVKDATGWPFFVEVQSDGTLAFSGNWMDPFIIIFRSPDDAERVADLIVELLKPEVTGSFIPVTVGFPSSRDNDLRVGPRAEDDGA